MASHDPSMRPHDRPAAPIADRRVRRPVAARDTHSPITTRRVVFNTRHAQLMRIGGLFMESSRARPFASTRA